MSMTLEEAIIHAEEVVDRCEVTDGDRACAEAHRQLAEWLRELQETRKERDYWQEKAHSYEQTIFKLTDAISKQPEIIYCHECKHFQCNMRFDGSVPKGADAYECRHWCGGCDPMDYCSCGERAERRADAIN